MVVRVLVVEDERLAAEAHASYVGRVDGFELAGVARSGREALRHLDSGSHVDLLLLDLHLPDGFGLDLLLQIRAAGHACDAIAVTSARDVAAVRRAVSQGVVLYLLKPFTFATFRAKLRQYADYRARLAAAPEVTQHEVDRAFDALRPREDAALPKGIGAESLRHVTDLLRAADRPLSATEVATDLGVSRVTARRYLEHLADTGALVRGQRYGRSGRPEVEYRWAEPGASRRRPAGH
jgi:response regulator of citrate/malate metabolism